MRKSIFNAKIKNELHLVCLKSITRLHSSLNILLFNLVFNFHEHKFRYTKLIELFNLRATNYVNNISNLNKTTKFILKNFYTTLPLPVIPFLFTLILSFFHIKSNHVIISVFKIYTFWTNFSI